MAKKQMKETLQSMRDHAYDISSEYNGNLTLRQLYYRFIALDLFPEDRRWTLRNGRWYRDPNGSKNAEPNYKWLGNLIADARMAGTYPFDWLLDRTREARPGRFSGDQTDVDSALDSAARELRRAPESWLWRDRWLGQSVHVSVWVEKEALAGVFEDPCEDLGVAWFVLRGYSSLSALSQWVDHVAEACDKSDAIEQAVVLYFGDHDPDGWEIPRSAERNVHAIADVRGIYLPDVTFERVALVRPQIERYNPPPFPAKETSSRFESYVREHKLRDAWELDALRPEVLAALIREHVDRYFEPEIMAANEAVVRIARDEMRGKMREPGWVDGALGGTQ
jgi:hypothetical protein